jgi:hypothetical protein
MIHRKILIATAIIASVVVTACSDMTAPKKVVPGRVAAAQVGTEAITPSLSATFPRRGALHVTKECSAYTGLAGSFCTITSSNIKEIQTGTRVVYARGAGATSLESDVTLYPPGPGNNTAFGHVVIDFVAAQGLVTISGGTGKFTWLNASAVVSHLSGPNWAWDGTYEFSPRD